MRLTAFFVLVIFSALATAEARTDLRDVEFWRQSAGWWLAVNSYFDGDMNSRLPEYHTLTGVEVLVDRVIETEYKFYPPGEFSSDLSDGKISPENGVELLTVSEHLATGVEGAVRQTDSVAAATVGMNTRVLAADSGIRQVVDADSGYEHYRQYLSLNKPDRRYILTLGLASDPGAEHAGLGALRGFSLSRGERFDRRQVESERARLRIRYSVGGIVSLLADGTRHVSHIDNESGSYEDERVRE